MGYSIAIDGPAGAGKSTIARRVAKELSFLYVDTGAMYRAMGLHMIRKGIGEDDASGIEAECEGADVTIAYKGGEQQVFLNGENVSGLIRTERAGAMASAVAKIPKVRERLVRLQQKLARTADVVMDGRDIGTVVLPDATAKVYLTASAEERARRRSLELRKKGVPCGYEEILSDIRARDRQDMSREASPLRQAEDAVLVDSTSMDMDEVTRAIIGIFREKAGEGAR